MLSMQNPPFWECLLADKGNAEEVVVHANKAFMIENKVKILLETTTNREVDWVLDVAHNLVFLGIDPDGDK